MKPKFRGNLIKNISQEEENKEWLKINFELKDAVFDLVVFKFRNETVFLPRWVEHVKFNNKKRSCPFCRTKNINSDCGAFSQYKDAIFYELKNSKELRLNWLFINTIENQAKT